MIKKPDVFSVSFQESNLACHPQTGACTTTLLPEDRTGSRPESAFDSQPDQQPVHHRMAKRPAHLVKTPADPVESDSSGNGSADSRLQRMPAPVMTMQPSGGKCTGKTVRFTHAGQVRESGDDGTLRTAAPKRREQKWLRKSRARALRQSGGRTLVVSPDPARTARRLPSLMLSTRFAFTALPTPKKEPGRSHEQVLKSLSQPAWIAPDKETYAMLSENITSDRIQSPLRKRKAAGNIMPPGSDIPPAEFDELALLSTASRIEEDGAHDEARWTARNKHAARSVGGKPACFADFIERIAVDKLEPLHREMLLLLTARTDELVSYQDFQQCIAVLDPSEDMLNGRKSIQAIVMSLKSHFRVHDWPWEFIETQQGLIYLPGDEDRNAMKAAMRLKSLTTPGGITFTPAQLRQCLPGIQHDAFWDAVSDILSGSHLSMRDLVERTELPIASIEDFLAMINHVARHNLNIGTLIFHSDYGYQTPALQAHYQRGAELAELIPATLQGESPLDINKAETNGTIHRKL